MLKSGKEFAEGFLKDKKNIKILYVILFIGIIFLAISSFVPEREKNEEAQQTNPCADLEERLEQSLSQIQGVGKTEVIVTYSAGSERVLATDRESDMSESSSRQSEKVVTVNKGGEQMPVIRSEKSPVVHGVVVICDGGANAAVQKNLREAVGALTGVLPHNIGIFKRKE